MSKIIATEQYQFAHGRKPRGRGLWIFQAAGDKTEQACRAQYGDAHDDHLALNSECPWCGAGRVQFTGTFSEAVRQLPASVRWVVQP